MVSKGFSQIAVMAAAGALLQIEAVVFCGVTLLLRPSRLESYAVKSRSIFPLVIVALGLASLQVHAAFTSFYVFGDSLSASHDNVHPAPGDSNYYGLRWSNGRVWVEALAQMQGLTLYDSNNFSYFGNTSTSLVTEVANFIPPSDASNALVVIWVNNADLYYPATASSPSPAGFNAVINAVQTNQYQAITNLYYAKGIRTLVMPNVVNISSIPLLNQDLTYSNVYYQASLDYNAAFTATLNSARANCPGLTIYTPDFYTLLKDLIAHPSAYGVTNALEDIGNGPKSVDVLHDPNLSSFSLSNGIAPTYIFWDFQDPTAKVHAIMASIAHQMISPVQIAKLTAFTGSNRLDLVNVPVYTNVPNNGLVLSCTNLASGNWTTNLPFSTTNTTQSVWGTNSGPQTFYRLKFPYVWAWP